MRKRILITSAGLVAGIALAEMFKRHLLKHDDDLTD